MSIALPEPAPDAPPRRGDRLYWLRRIKALDPQTQHEEIYRISAGHEFPWDYNRALELALFRTYCVPSISGLLEATGEFAQRPQKRYDDTALLMAEIVKHGYDAPRGKESLRSINRMHGQYNISNDDMRYVLSTFVYEPVDWIDRFGWRRLCEQERQAAYHYYREVGTRMGIKEIPPDYESFRRFKADYEREHFRYADTNARVGRSTLDLVRSWVPRPVRPVADAVVRALLDERTREAFGFAAPLRGWCAPSSRPCGCGRRWRPNCRRAAAPCWPLRPRPAPIPTGPTATRSPSWAAGRPTTSTRGGCAAFAPRRRRRSPGTGAGRVPTAGPDRAEAAGGGPCRLAAPPLPNGRKRKTIAPETRGLPAIRRVAHPGTLVHLVRCRRPSLRDQPSPVPLTREFLDVMVVARGG
ncbi:oxygenase MpaB family protein [Salinactinospora qingdaonensis]|uniref:ER-bound oxygenase mpaB/mpaB'/Rubber oxygenase catalytic domain-containing protein n=1 Tax=Salinactinospora qingdaonensis TaxID=702744 RepID=A0ABP7G6D9_9ACTN